MGGFQPPRRRRRPTQPEGRRACQIAGKIRCRRIGVRAKAIIRRPHTAGQRPAGDDGAAQHS